MPSTLESAATSDSARVVPCVDPLVPYDMSAWWRFVIVSWNTTPDGVIRAASDQAGVLGMPTSDCWPFAHVHVVSNSQCASADDRNLMVFSVADSDCITVPMRTTPEAALLATIQVPPSEAQNRVRASRRCSLRN